MLSFKNKIFYMLFFMCLIFILFSNTNISEAFVYEKQISNIATMHIDDPIYMKNIKDKLYIRGWVMSNTSNISINVYIDNKLIDIVERNEKREDVIKAISGYGGRLKNPIPGFNKQIDISNVLDGQHILKIEVKDKDNSKILTFRETIINVKKYNTKTHIDSPRYNENSKYELYVRGWVMSETENSIVELYIDNKFVQTLEKNEKREDVIKAILDCGGKTKNPIPGFNKIIDISNLANGTHTLEIRIRNKTTNEILTSQSTKFYIDSSNVSMYIDDPIYNQNVESKLYVRGWVMSYVEDIELKVYIDNNLIDNIERNQNRQDVLNAISGYGGKTKNPIPGFERIIDISNISNGVHTLKIKVVNKNNNQVLKEETQRINVNKYKVKMHIDNPTYNQNVNDKLYVRGWVMSESQNIDIKLYINNQLVDTIERNEKREDVIKAIIGYGGITSNPIPGFNKEIDISNYKNGNYKITVKIIDKNTNETITYNEVYVNKNQNTNSNQNGNQSGNQNESTKKYLNGIDVSHHQGVIDWKKVKNDNIDFAIIRAGFRGYGESGSLNKDTRFDYNIKNAISNNIDVGVYFFSQATTVEEAIEEANYTLNLIKGYKITYPVIIDVEYANEAHSGRADNVSKETRTQIVIAFCERIKEEGYIPMFYSDKWFLTDNLDASKLQNYEYWLAHYTGATRDNPFLKPSNYKGKYSMWQYSAKGQVDGISTNVDLNIGYKQY